jgi:hypothetical protein
LVDSLDAKRRITEPETFIPEGNRSTVGIAPAWVWAPVLAFGVLMAVLAYFGIISFGTCMGGEILTVGIVSFFIGTGVGLAWHPYALVVLDGVSVFLIILGYALPHTAGSC